MMMLINFVVRDESRRAIQNERKSPFENTHTYTEWYWESLVYDGGKHTIAGVGRESTHTKWLVEEASLAI